jgi:hypothetical protein
VQRDLVAASGVLRGNQIGLGLLPILERAALRQIQLMVAFLGGLRHGQLRARGCQIGERGDQVVLCLHELARMDHKERGAGLDNIAEHGNHPDDPPGIMRENRGRQIIVDRDSPLSYLLGTK